MMPILLHTPWFNVYSYGLLGALGYGLATAWILRAARRDGLDADAVFDMLIVMMVVGVLGARVAFLIEMAPVVEKLPPFWAIESGGLTFYGAWICSTVWCFIFLTWKKMPFWRTMDAVGMGWPLGMAFARCGCLFAGCCYGTPTTLPWGLVFPQAGPMPRHPTQLYEVVCFLAVFALMQWYGPRRRAWGQPFVLSIGTYAVVRWFLEFWREENAVWAAGMTFSQMLSIALALLAGAIFVQQGRNPHTQVPPRDPALPPAS